MDKQPSLHIRLIGTIDVLVHGQAIEHVRTRKDLWLLAYLAVHHGKTVRREQVADILWPDLGTPAARDNLRHSLWRLRRTLDSAADYITTTSTSIMLSDRATVDTTEFIRLASTVNLEAWQAAAGLWQGRPLAEIDAEWADDAAIMLENAYRELLSRTSHQLEHDGKPVGALVYALRLALLDPYRDDVCRQVMQLLAHAGQRREAEEYYRHFERLLADELDAQPEPATFEAAKLLRYPDRPESRTTPMGSLGQSTSTVHQAEELAKLLHARARFREALELLETVALTYARDGDSIAHTRVIARIGQVLADKGECATGLTRIQSQISSLESDPKHPGLSALYVTLALLHHGCGNYEEQLRAAERAVQLSVATEDDRTRAAALAGLGLALINLGKTDQAQERLHEAIILSETAGDAGTLGDALHNAAWSLETSGNFAAAMPLLQRALVLAEAQNDPIQEAYIAQSLGRNAFYAGQWLTSRQYLIRAEALSRREDTTWVSPYPLLELGRLTLAEGEDARAREYLNRSLSLADHLHDLQAQRTVHRLLAEADILSGRPHVAVLRLESALKGANHEEVDVSFVLPVLAWARLESQDAVGAHELIVQSLALAAHQRNAHTKLQALRVGGLVAIRREEYAVARRQLEQALALPISDQYPYARGRILVALAEVDRRNDAFASARKRLRQALTIFNDLRANREIALTQRALW